MMPSENLVVQPSEKLCNIGCLSKKITEGSWMSKEKEYRHSIKNLKSLVVYLKEVETEVWKVLAHIADREFSFLLCHKRKTGGQSVKVKAIN